jgi:hypothetical protein
MAQQTRGRRVDRGQRVAGETRFRDAGDGKTNARFVRPFDGHLPADTAGLGPGAAATVEDVVETPERASSWEALEDDADHPATPDRKGRDPARTHGKT